MHSMAGAKPPHYTASLFTRSRFSVLSCTRPHLGDLKDRVRGGGAKFGLISGERLGSSGVVFI